MTSEGMPPDALDHARGSSYTSFAPPRDVGVRINRDFAALFGFACCEFKFVVESVKEFFFSLRLDLKISKRRNSKGLPGFDVFRGNSQQPAWRPSGNDSCFPGFLTLDKRWTSSQE